MVFITHEVVIIVFAIVITIAIAAAFIINPGSYDQSRWKVFIITVAGLGILLTVMFYYSVINIQQTQNELLFIKENIQMMTTVNEVVDKISKGMDKGSSLASELTPLEKEGKGKKKEKEENGYRYSLAQSIFSTWQLTTLERKYVSVQEEAYMYLFLQWASSCTLRKQWVSLKLAYTERTRMLGDLLFAHAPEVHTVAEFGKAVTSLVTLPRYKSIMSC